MVPSKKVLSFFVFTIIVLGSLLYINRKAEAIGFGGIILSSSPCTNGILLLVSPPVGGLFLLPLGARLYPHFSVKPGSWVLGNYVPTGVCVAGLIPIPTQGTIYMMGTSK